MLEALRNNFLSNDIKCIANGFWNLQVVHSHEVQAFAIEESLMSWDDQKRLIVESFKASKAKARKLLGKDAAGDSKPAG